MLLLMFVSHMRIDIPATCGFAAARFQTEPVFTFVVTLKARIVNRMFKKLINRCNVFFGAVRAVCFWRNSVKSLH